MIYGSQQDVPKCSWDRRDLLGQGSCDTRETTGYPTMFLGQKGPGKAGTVSHTGYPGMFLGQKRRAMAGTV